MKRIKWTFAAITVIAISSAFVTKPKSVSTNMNTYPVTSGSPITTYIYVDVNNLVNPADKGITYTCDGFYDQYCTITIDPQWVDAQGRVLGTNSYHGLIDYTGRFTQ
jgi:hypothetical protein